MAIVKRKTSHVQTNSFGDLSDDSNFSYDEESDIGDNEIERKLLEEGSQEGDDAEMNGEEENKEDDLDEAAIEKHRSVRGEDEGVGASFLNELLQDNNKARASANLS